MAWSLRTFLIALGTLAACGPQPVTTDDAGRMHVAAVCAPEALTATLQQHDEATLVVALDVGGADVLASVRAAGRAQQPFVVAVGPYREGMPLPDALVAEATGADVAIDLALLACTGIPTKNTRYEVGTRTWTEANRRAGGTATLAPADPILAMLRAQHAQRLTTSPATDEVHRIAFVLPGDAAPWQRAALAEAEAAAARYPQLDLAVASDAETAVQGQPRLLILATHDAAETAAVRQAAGSLPDGPRPVIVLDPLLDDRHDTCRIGCSPRTLAQAAAVQVRALLPDGGNLVVCVRKGGTATTSMRLDAFAEAMGFDPAALR
ncbi:MAG: hypothetical protein ACE37K_14005 [Planctomycetota bacterium]